MSDKSGKVAIHLVTLNRVNFRSVSGWLRRVCLFGCGEEIVALFLNLTFGLFKRYIVRA